MYHHTKRAHLSETLASLRFAARVAKIPITRNYIQSEPDPLLHAAVLKEEVESLRRELQVQCLLTSGNHAIGTEPLTLNQLSEVNRQARVFTRYKYHMITKALKIFKPS